MTTTMTKTAFWTCKPEGEYTEEGETWEILSARRTGREEVLHLENGDQMVVLEYKVNMRLVPKAEAAE